ncbi:MAG: hypothetical protein ABSG43_24765 [Solirubrobacteraceae bacterium]
MPTYERTARFRREFAALDARKQRQALAMVRAFVAGLNAGRLPASLRIKRVQGTRDVFEITWAPDGRATFEYGPEQKPGEPHVIWRRIGSHDILREP